MAITRLAVAQGWKLYLLNRGNRPAEDIPKLVEKLNPGDGWGFVPLKAKDVTAIYTIAAHATLE